MVEALLAGGLSLVGGWAGAYLGGYLNKKGENLATHEDINKLVDQVRAVTQTTKEIEAKISDQVWNRQKQWELKRETLFEAIRALAGIEDALVGLHSVMQVEKQPDNVTWVTAKLDKTLEWTKAYSVFEEASLLVAAVCTKEVGQAFQKYGSFLIGSHTQSHRMMMVIFIRNLKWNATRNIWSCGILFVRNWELIQSRPKIRVYLAE